jgi:hypothetical protein
LRPSSNNFLRPNQQRDDMLNYLMWLLLEIFDPE